MQHHQISSQYIEVPRRIKNISSHVCYFHNKYDDMVCSHTMISGEKHFLEDRSCPHASTHRKHHTHNRTHQTYIVYNNKPTKHKRGLCFCKESNNYPLHTYFLLGGVPFCLEYNISNTIYYDVMTPADRSASHIMYPIWPNPSLPPYMYMQVSMLE